MKGNVREVDKLNNLVLIHGWGFSSQIWSDFIPYLENNWRITVVDLPGYASKETNDTVEIAQSGINQVVNTISLDIPQESTLFAWSMGGLVAGRLACVRQDIKALVFVASSPCFLKRTDWLHGVEPEEFNYLLRSLDKNKTKALQEFVGLIAMGDKYPKQTIKELSKYVGKNVPSLETLKKGLSLLREEDLRNTLSDLRCSVGMIFGRNDVLVKRSTSKAVQILSPDIHTIEISETGHAPFLTRPQETADALTRLTATLF